jgi:3-hydroxyisobutyrate dehydrogenase-like beta-hydroxyacid dehydrogenase
MGDTISQLSTTVSVLGLGATGTAVARQLISDGHTVTVWTRSRRKAAPFSRVGAQVAATASDAVLASPISFVALTDAAAVRDVLETEAVRRALAGRILVNLTADEPTDAVRLESLASRSNAKFLDARIEWAFSAGVATGGFLACAGPRSLFDEWSPILGSLGLELEHVGDDIRAADLRIESDGLAAPG